MSDYSMSAWDLAIKLYENSDKTDVALHNRPTLIRDAWLKTAQRQISSGTVSMDDIATVVAH
jgi:hypothetical protein